MTIWQKFPSIEVISGSDTGDHVLVSKWKDALVRFNQPFGNLQDTYLLTCVILDVQLTKTSVFNLILLKKLVWIKRCWNQWLITKFIDYRHPSRLIWFLNVPKPGHVLCLKVTRDKVLCLKVTRDKFPCAAGTSLSQRSFVHQFVSEPQQDQSYEFKWLLQIQ